MIASHELSRLIDLAEQVVESSANHSAPITALRNAVMYYRTQNIKLDSTDDDIRMTEVCQCGVRNKVLRPHTVDNKPIAQVICLSCCRSELFDR